MPSRWLRMSRPGRPNFTTGPKTKSQSERSSGFNFNSWLDENCLELQRVNTFKYIITRHLRYIFKEDPVVNESRRTDAADMLKRRLKQAGLPAHYSLHSFRQPASRTPTAREGLASARAKGRLLGRPKGVLGKSRLDGKEEEIRVLLQKQVSKASIAKIVGVTRPTIYHFIKTRRLRPHP
jgi:hypothetical protein